VNNIEKELHMRLKTRFTGRKLAYFTTLPSTMDAAREMAKQGTAEGTAVIAGEQTAGRGRLGRSWFSPRGSLAMSVILRPELSQAPQLIMMASLAVAGTVRDVTGLDAGIKWPNDILIKGKKVCGVLIENEIRGDELAYSIIGIGLNINVPIKSQPDIAPIATSLSDELGKPVSYEEITAALLNHLEEYYLRLTAGGSLALEWRARMVSIGKRVRVQSGDSVLEGNAEDVTSGGALLLRRSDGSLATIVAGDVTLLKMP
jgi:BirA family biotin operon repressor/biotin-[acetyl-CoA-carboxylase] ligase